MSDAAGEGGAGAREEDEEQLMPTRPDPVVGRKPWQPPAKLNLREEVGAAVGERIKRVGAVQAMEVPSAETLAALAMDAVAAADECRMELARRDAECSRLRRELERAQSAGEEARPSPRLAPAAEQSLPSVHSTQGLRSAGEPGAAGKQSARGRGGGAKGADTGAVILNWVHFQMQLRQAQSNATRMRQELGDKCLELRQAEEAEHESRQRERRIADELAKLDAVAQQRAAELRGLQAQCAQLQQEIRNRVARAEHDALASAHSEALREVEELRALSESLRRRLRQQEHDALSELEGARQQYAERERDLRRLLREAADEQHRLQQQLLDAEHELCPELRRRIMALTAEAAARESELAETHLLCSELQAESAAARSDAAAAAERQAAAEAAALRSEEAAARGLLAAEAGAELSGGPLRGSLSALAARAQAGDEAALLAAQLGRQEAELQGRLRNLTGEAQQRARAAAEAAGRAARSETAELVARQQAALLRVRQQEREAREEAEAHAAISAALASAAGPLCAFGTPQRRGPSGPSPEGRSVSPWRSRSGGRCSISRSPQRRVEL